MTWRVDLGDGLGEQACAVVGHVGGPTWRADLVSGFKD